MRQLQYIKLLSIAFIALALSGCGGGGNQPPEPPQLTTFTVGGTVSGLSGSVILRLNGSNDLTVNASGTFTFATQLANGASYNVTIVSQPSTQVCGPTVTNGTGTIGGASVTNVQIACASYSIGGTVTGLKADTTLVVNGNVDIPVLANATTFASPPGMSLGAVGILYHVAIKTQPAGQTCTIIQSTGAVTSGAANVSGATGPAVDCVDNVTDAFTGTYLIEGDEDDEGFAVVTFNADGTYLLGVRNDEPASANDVCAGKSGVQHGVYNWNQATQVLRIVKHAPIGFGEDCGLDVGTAVTVSPNVGDDDGELTLIAAGSNPPVVAGRMIPVESTPDTLTGSWGGPQAFAVFTSDNQFFLATTRWIVQNNAHSPGIEHGCYSLSSGNASGSFTFNLGGSCTVNGTLPPVDSTGASGFSAITAASNFTVNGDVLQAVAGGGFVTPLTGSATRIVPTQLPAAYSISATITGLNAPGLKLQNNGKSGGEVNAGADTAVVASSISSGASYFVTVQQQPTGLYCTVSNGTGVAFANVTNVAVSCAPIPATTYTVSGTVNGLTGAGLALRLNDQPGGAFNANPTPPAPAGYGFAAGLQTGTSFAVTVASQPVSPTQFCFATTPAAGTINGSNVTVNFNCVNSAQSVVSGNVSGLAAGQSLQLRLNYTDAAGVPAAPANGTVNANGAFNVFAGNAVPANGVFELGITTQPAGQTCTITRSRGTAIANVGNVVIACVDNPTSALRGTYSAMNEDGDGRHYINFNADGTYTTAMIHNEWACGSNRFGNGVEYGVFRWNPATGEFQQPRAAVIDTNDGCGFNDSDGDSFSGYITRAGNSIEIREAQGGPVLVTAAAVQSNAGTLVGAWVREAGNGSLLVFHPDGTYLHVETQTFFPTLPNPTGLNGQERGCYAASAPTSGTITVTVDAGCRPDDLASYDISPGGGLLNFPLLKARSYSFDLAGDTLTFNGVVYRRTSPN